MFTELVSFLGYLWPDFRQIAFFVVVGLVLILSLIDLKFGILILLAELFIGSKGYLFYFAGKGIIISIRIALWLIVMAIWAAKKLIKKNKKELKPYAYFIPLFLFIVWGLVNGYLNNNNFNNIFFDFNGWLYFALLFPLANFMRRPNSIYEITQIFIACLIWLSFKTLILFFIFSHNFNTLTYEIYRWVRESGVGEITKVQGGFYRIFFQSHIYILLGFFILLIFLANQTFKNKKNIIVYGLWLTVLGSIIIISFSRSFWVGGIIGFLIYFGFLIKKYNWEKIFKILGLLFLSAFATILLITTILYFPYPEPLGGFNTKKILSDRITETDEAAISSRWQLLPKLWEEIRQAPILGKGFGTTVTYLTKDPRALENNLNGEYTTYAFEWGWLDIWLKLGIFGLLAYLTLLGKIIHDGFKKRANNLILGLTIGVIVISVVSFFTPYLNHPLGIGYLILASLIISTPTKKISDISY